jgi:hypothetical protein
MAKKPARRNRASRALQLPSGRAVALSVRNDVEELQVTSPDGMLELKVIFGVEGPVVSLRCTRLELTSPDTVSVRCRKFEVETTDAVSISGGELRATTSGNMWLNGEKIFLNCESQEEIVEEPT